MHAKVSGYIRRINVDIGDRVRAGEVLATLEIPELDAELKGSDAEVRHSQDKITRAQNQVAFAQSQRAAVHSAYTRLQQAAKAQPGMIAEQELDDAQARDQSAPGAETLLRRLCLLPGSNLTFPLPRVCTWVQWQTRQHHCTIQRRCHRALCRYRFPHSGRHKIRYANSPGYQNCAKRHSSSQNARARVRCAIHPYRWRSSTRYSGDGTNPHWQDCQVHTLSRHFYSHHADRSRCAQSRSKSQSRHVWRGRDLIAAAA